MIRIFLCVSLFLFGFVFSEQTPKICLTMIVKNESKIIERCLNSVKDVVDYIFIADTGSSDNTVEIIESFMQQSGIPGKVHRHEWKNFGHNRTLSVNAAQKMLFEFKEPVNNVYLLLIDADMILEVSPEFSKNSLIADSYLLEQKNSSMAYYNTRLIRAGLPWMSKGVTHEYWSCLAPHQGATLQTVKINDRDDGGCKSDKFQRDLKLLTDGLKEEPDNVRYIFYIAQTYKCLGQYDEAIHWYKKRIEKGSWKEEVWYSKFMIAESYEAMGFWDQALHWYLEAYQYSPERAEPLKNIATHYRFALNNELAYLFAKQGSQIPYPKTDLLFVSHPVYDYQFDEELSIVAYYTKFKEEGFSAVNRLMLSKEAPHSIKEQAFKNMLFYVENLKDAKIVPISIERPRLTESSDEKYYAMNPSIQTTPEGFSLICRTVNFEQKGGTNYKSRTPGDDSIRTRNYLVTMDKKFTVLSQKEIVEELPRERFQTLVKGLEDCRLISSKGNCKFLTAVFDVPPGTVVQALCETGKISGANSLQVNSLVPLKGPAEWRCEKNWLPFVKENAIYAIYSHDPMIVLKIDEKTGHCEQVVKKEHAKDFSRFRGSAGPIELDDGYLTLVHEVTFTDQRMYTHRLVFLDKDFNIQKVSKPFTFMHKGIEYCCGMTLDHDKKNCIFSIGFEDREAYLCVVSKDNILALLESVQ